MYVYFLFHKTDRRFKVGKARDVYQRFLALGGHTEYSVSDSAYIELAGDDAAFRVERSLHRLFDAWRLPTTEGQRYEGDTEHFDVVCWPRMLRFLEDNRDLVHHQEIVSLAQWERSISVPHRHARPRGSAVSKYAKRLARTAQAETLFAEALHAIEVGIARFDSLSSDSFKVRLDYDLQLPALVIETTDPLAWEIAHEVVFDSWMDLHLGYPDGSWGSKRIFGSATGLRNQTIRASFTDLSDELIAPYGRCVEQVLAQLTGRSTRR